MRTLKGSRLTQLLTFTIGLIAGCSFLLTSTAFAQNWTEVGSSPVVGSQDNQVVTAYACTDQVSNVLWKVKTKFTLADSYKTPDGFNWTATVTNSGSDPIKNDQSVSKNFKDTVQPHVQFHIDVYPVVSSPLTFSYSAGSASLGTTVQGTIAQNALPQDFASCQ